MANSHERKKSPDERVKGPQNNLRVDLYRRLFQQIQVQDQRSGAQGFVLHWDDPDAQWDKSDDIRAVWDAIGLTPIIQTLFYVIETLEGEELELLESLDTIVDPLNTPAALLPYLSASFGYRVREDLDEDTQRVVVQGLFHAYKVLGQRIGFDVFYRMIGFSIVKVYPLWKKDINEDQNRYSRERYVTTDVEEAVGPAGNTAYVTTLSFPAVLPGTLRITDGNVTLRDQPTSFVTDGLVLAATGEIIGPGGETGTIRYSTGELSINFGAPTAGPVTASYQQVTDEFPYRAARMDMEILMNPLGEPIPETNNELVRSLFDRLEETKPIHVVLRAMTLAFELDETVTPAASDAVACATFVKDSRDPFEINPGREDRYILDASPGVAQDDLFIEHASSGTQEQTVVLEDVIKGFTCPGLDVLEIDAGPFSQTA